ncbi:MAG: hypothetical protein HFH31_03365 [Bacilli bacterium]|nr:hypothetical protein [Bacilli bacterium]
MKQSVLFLSVVLLAFLSFYFEVSAECSYEESSKLKSIASNINHDYSYKENTEKNKISFTVRFTNVLSQLKIYDMTGKKTYYSNANNEIIISNVAPGKTYHYQIGMKEASIKNNKFTFQERVGDHFETRVIDLGTSTCNIENIMTIDITIPFYNSFYQSDICKKYPENKMCDKWYQHNDSYNKFVSKIELEVKKQETTKQEEQGQKEITFFDILTDFLQKYYLSLIGVVILIVGVIVLYMNTKNKRTDFEGWK